MKAIRSQQCIGQCACGLLARTGAAHPRVLESACLHAGAAA
jgi:hypothetical protein